MSTPQDGTIELKIVSAITKSLKSFGFQYAIRNCRTPKYGDDAYVEENWNAKTLATFISQDVERLISQEAARLAESVIGEDEPRDMNLSVKGMTNARRTARNSVRREQPQRLAALTKGGDHGDSNNPVESA